MVSGGFAVAAVCALVPLTVATASTAGNAGAAHNAAASQLKTVRYLGYTFRVPRQWPVIDNRVHGGGCVRFDQHAVYLGAAPAEQSCPSWLLGTTESVLIQQGPARSRRVTTEDPVARQVSSRAPGITVFATFDADPTVIYRMLASASLPAPVIRSVSPARSGARLAGHAARALAAGRHSARTHWPVPDPPLPAGVASYRGLGFDACTAPSRRVMRAWRRKSPYRAIGIYVGGADRACAQPNLTRSWVRTQARAGWHFIPLYAGPQAAFHELRAPARQGWSAARDAVAAMRRLGFGRRTPVYYDMEAFGSKVRRAAMRFMSAWTRELHRLGYRSGVYSSSDSGIRDLSRARGRRRHRVAMPDVIYDALWNGRATTKDHHLRSGQWHHNRIHQFSGNVTQRFGGVAINIDQDFLDVRLHRRPATRQATPAVSLPDGSADVFYRGPGGRLWFVRALPERGWTAPAKTASRARSAPSAVWTGSAVDVFYKGPGGRLWVDSYRPDGHLIRRQDLAMMGVIGSAPRAVGQSDGVVDVFWRGSADDHLWHGQYTPGSGWDGPQKLGGDLASGPAPVVSSDGTTTVLWEGTDLDLWECGRGLLGTWSAPRNLGMGPLGGAPRATAQADGQIQVYWHGKGNAYVWEGFYRPGSGWRGPKDLGGTVASAPWPATAGGTVRVLWRGRGHGLAYISHRHGKGWDLPGWQHPAPARLGWLGSAPFAAVGDSGAALRVFWFGRHGALWTASLISGSWSAAARLTG